MPKSYEIETRWWGWGDINKTYPVEERPTYIPFLEEKLDIKVEQVRHPDPDLAQLKLRRTRLKAAVRDKLIGIVGADNFSNSCLSFTSGSFHFFSITFLQLLFFEYLFCVHSLGS